MCIDLPPGNPRSLMTESNSAPPARVWAEDRRHASRLVPQLFTGIDEPILDEILADCAIRDVVDGEAILIPGQKNQAINILLSGRLKIYLDEQEPLFIDIKPGECVGEMSIIEERPVSAYVVAEEPSRLLIVPEDSFWRLMSSTPVAAKNLLRTFSHRIRARDQATLQRIHERLALEKELKIARSIQTSLLRTDFDPLSRNGVDLFAIMDPVKEIGGDFYDAYFITPTKLFICVGDVVGKGIPAALFMVKSITHLRMEGMRDPTPHAVLDRVNRALCENNELDLFITLFCGVLDTATGDLIYANGGHNPPLSDRESGVFEFIPMPEGLILGLFETARFESAHIGLKPGQSLLAYTDGVPEAMNRAGEFFAEQRLQAVLNANAHADPRTLIEAVRREVYVFTGNQHPADDLTLLALRYSG